MPKLNNMDQVAIKFGFGKEDGPFPGVPVIAVYDAAGEFMHQYYMDEDDYARMRKFVLDMEDPVIERE